MRPRRFAQVLPLLLALLLPGGAAVAEERRPVVVELFTSQGCASCPPADALLGELATRPGVIALAFHVDYWDYIGWRDPYGDAAHTARQRDYAATLGLHMVYTPQMVIAGRHDVVGSQRAAVETALAEARADPLPLAVTLDRDGQLRIAGPEGVTGPGGAAILAVVYMTQAETAVAEGENGGRILSEYNIVRAVHALGDYGGGQQALPLDPERLKAAGPDAGSLDGCAILVQDRDSGRILGAAVVTE